MNQNTITPIRILEYVDCPQLFMARDKFDTQYICLLYADEPECRYSAVRISNERYAAYCQQKVDLRALFENPEFEGEYFEVADSKDCYTIERLQSTFLPEDRLPERGFYFDGSDNVKLTISIPKQEENLFQNIIRRHGWIAF